MFENNNFYLFLWILLSFCLSFPIYYRHSNGAVYQGYHLMCSFSHIYFMLKFVLKIVGSSTVLQNLHDNIHTSQYEIYSGISDGDDKLSFIRKRNKTLFYVLRKMIFFELGTCLFISTNRRYN